MLRQVIAVALALPLGAADAAPPAKPPDAPAAAAAAELPPAADAGYRFAVGQLLQYAYTLRQDVAWESAGDRLAYATTMEWLATLQPTAVEPGKVVIDATITRVRCVHEGPGATHAVNSRPAPGATEPLGRGDPLLGHLLLLAGATFTIDLDPRTGAVRAVTGGEQFVQRLRTAVASDFPGQDPAIVARARQLYDQMALARWWAPLLALPGAESAKLELNAPLAGHLVRTWEGDRYTLALPPEPLPSAKLLGDPTPVAVVLRDVQGGGSVRLIDGLPGEMQGEISFGLALEALTQPVVQRHRTTWNLKLLRR